MALERQRFMRWWRGTVRAEWTNRVAKSREAPLCPWAIQDLIAISGPFRQLHRLKMLTVDKHPG